MICSNDLINRILVIQKRTVRYLCKARIRDSCKPLFLAHGILTVISIYILETACLMHKHKSNVITTSPHYVTRQTGILALPSPRSSLVKGSIIYQMVISYIIICQTILKILFLIKVSGRQLKIFLLKNPIII